MFGKLKKKKSEYQGEAPVDNTAKMSGPKKKKKWNSAEMVLVGGLVLIVGGMFWLMSGGLGESKASSAKDAKVSKKAQETKAPAKKEVVNTPFYGEEKTQVSQENSAGTVSEKVESSPPFVYDNQADFSNENLVAPPEAYEQNISKLAKQSAPLPKESLPEENKQKSELESKEKMQRSVSAKTETLQPNLPQVEAHKGKVKSMPEVQASDAAPSHTTTLSEAADKEKPNQNSVAQGSYVCSIVDGYRDMLGKEIMYYVKDVSSQKYLPAYGQPNWDESGVWVKKKLIAMQVDIAERMVEVSKGKWIPALEFMTCTLMQEDAR